MTYQVIVIGGGIAGSAAALRAAQYHLKTLWIMGDRKTAKKSRARWVKNIDNMIGIHPDVMLDQIKDDLKDQPDALKIISDKEYFISTQAIIDNVEKRLQDYKDFVDIEHVKATDVVQGDTGFEVTLDSEERPAAQGDAVVLATGLMDVQPHIAKMKGDKLMEKTAWIYPFANDESVLYCIRCEGHLTRHHKTAMIGSSEVTAQVGIMLAERYGQITHIFTNGEELQVKEDTQKLLDHYKIEVETAKIVDILNQEGARGQLKAFVLEDGKTVPMDFAFVAMGIFEVYNELAQKLGVPLADGSGDSKTKRVLINAKAETNVPNLFVVGDMAVRDDEPVMMQVYTAQEYAVRAVDAIDSRRRRALREKILNA